MTISFSAQQPPYAVDFDGAVERTAYDFPSADWSALTFTLPASGRAFVTISADLSTEWADPESWVEASVRVTGAAIAGNGKGIGGSGSKINLSRRILLVGTPGATVQVTPQFRYNHGSNEWTIIKYGSLVAEF